MANPHKGEVEASTKNVTVKVVEFAVEDRTYTLSYSVNAICELEEAVGGTPQELAAILSDPSKMTFRRARTIFRCGLIDHHPDVDERRAGEIMTEIGGMERAVALIGEAFTKAFPQEEAAENGTARPPARRSAAGATSSPRGSKPAAIPSNSGG